MGVLDNKFNDNLVTTTVDSLLNWAQNSSMWPLIMGTACCAIEMMAVGISRYDVLERWGMLYRFSPRQSDVMLVTGTVTKKMAPVVKTIYDQMADPKWVIAVGSCAISGNIYNSYSTLQGVDRIIPVDIYVPGCPPIPEAITYGILELQRKIGKQGSTIRKSRNEDMSLVINDALTTRTYSSDANVDPSDIARPGHIRMRTVEEYTAAIDNPPSLYTPEEASRIASTSSADPNSLPVGS